MSATVTVVDAELSSLLNNFSETANSSPLYTLELHVQSW